MEGHAVDLNVEDEEEAAEAVAIVLRQNSEACSKRFRDSYTDIRGGFWWEDFADGSTEMSETSFALCPY
jgi:uncharacterized protein involved in tolerance to divalent cations